MRLIDADALKEYIGGVRAEYNFFDDDERPRYEAHSKAIYLLDLYLDNAPTIDAVSVVHGEWILNKGLWLDKEFYPPKYQCNQCGHYVFAGTDRNFCPNCGARMKGADDE